jgi:hypothetical protein
MVDETKLTVAEQAALETLLADNEQLALVLKRRDLWLIGSVMKLGVMHPQWSGVSRKAAIRVATYCMLACADNPTLRKLALEDWPELADREDEEEID